VSYVESQLLSGETVIYRGHLHKLMFTIPVILGVVTVVSALGALAASAEIGVWLVVAGVFAVAATSWVMAWITYSTSEFAITNKRVVIKVGWIRRRSLETLLSKIEGISVDQGVGGRVLDYGTITITGTGGTRESFPRIAAPLEFRRQVQDVVSRNEDSRAAYGTTEPRAERDCPFCAERILVKAKVCKHCGREVPPA
jgi:uncharacterized membrane protein YdbT with pleckstrin-like domain